MKYLHIHILVIKVHLYFPVIFIPSPVVLQFPGLSLVVTSPTWEEEDDFEYGVVESVTLSDNHTPTIMFQ